jgi:cytochrome c-type biogenesis protein CcmH/NrfF
VNAILWVGPFLVICIGATILVRRARTAPSAAPLSAEEETRLASLTEETMT